jgi:glycosyltransferase involved in cell wall biosynthesis
MRVVDDKMIVFVTEHDSMTAQTCRFVLKLADRMSAVGYRTGVLNLGKGFPRPSWLVPPFLSVDAPAKLHAVLGLMGDSKITVATTSSAVFHITADSMRNGNRAYHWVDDIRVEQIPGLAEALLFSRSLDALDTITHSPWVADAIGGSGHRRPVLVPAPVDATFFSVPDLAPTTPTVGYSNELDPGDDRTVLDAFRQASEVVPGLALTSIGHAVEGRTAVEHVSLSWAEEASELRREALAGVSCFVHAPQHDAAGFRILEAMASGCPVIATRGQGYDVFCEDGVNCLLVPPGDSAAMAAAIRSVLLDDGVRERLADGGRETARPHTWEALLASLPDEIKAECRPEGARGLDAIKWGLSCAI